MIDKELENTNINIIDTECRYYDDDDSFGNIKITDNSLSESEDRPLNSKTGVIINFNDESVDYIDKPALRKEEPNLPCTSYIDLETDYPDDEDDDFDSKNFIDEDMFEEKHNMDIGKIEKDYWNKITKKHSASNKKGAAYSGFHFSGNPEKEMQMFNHAIGSDAAESTICAAGGNESSIGEALENIEDYADLSDIFNILGFEFFINSDKSISVIDQCNIEPDISGRSMRDILVKLASYIDDCFIYPLQFATGKEFTTCDDWVNWYTSDMQIKFPKCKKDIEYCKVINKYING